MTKTYLFIWVKTLCLLMIVNNSFSQGLNVEVLAEIGFNGERHSGSWIYSRSADEEYALIGAYSGLVAYDMETFEELAYIPGAGSNWRELTVVGDHAYVVTEGREPSIGMQVVYLGDLPDTAYLLTTFDSTFQTGHIIQRDVYTESPYVYIMGTNTSRGIHIIDISDPANPVEASVYDPGHYIHDAHVKQDRVFASAFYEGTIDILDITDKTNPTVLTRHEDGDGSIHSAWVTEDDNFLFVASERDGLLGKIWDIKNLNDIKLASTYTANNLSLVHNPYIRGNFAHIAHNSEGYRVLDIADPYLPVEVAYYDTYDRPSGGGTGLWSVCPYSLSGKVIGGDRHKGLFIWQTEEVRAGRKYLFLRDNKTKDPVFDADVIVNMDTIQSNVFGEVRIGRLPDQYDVTIQAEGYDEMMLTLDLESGMTDTMFVDLIPISTSTNDYNDAMINIHPNPSKGTINLSCSNGQFQYNIYSSQGRMIKEGHGNENTQVSIKESGVYRVVMKTEKGNYSQMVVVRP